jgi:hypothetical protein
VPCLIVVREKEAMMEIAMVVSVMMVSGLSALMIYGIERLWRQRTPRTRVICHQFRTTGRRQSRITDNYKIGRAA